MTTFAHNTDDDTMSLGAPEMGAGSSLGAIDVGDRIGTPVRRPRRRWLLKTVGIIAVTGGVWGYVTGQITVPDQLITELSTLAQQLTATSPKPVETAALPPPPIISTEPAMETASMAPAQPSVQPPTPEPVTKAPAAVPEAPATPPAPAAKPANRAPAAAKSADIPYQPPNLAPSDPNQKRASDIGLHPELSRVLLARLSPADYQNAATAIKTALAETPDDGVLVWPRQRKPEVALFRVHFVPGAAPDCRRYVVEVTKDGWMTTALPMEKCGIRKRQAAAAGAGKGAAR
jgi:hypothetical protein